MKQPHSLQKDFQTLNRQRAILGMKQNLKEGLFNSMF